MSQTRRRRTLGKVGRYAVDATPPLPEESPEEPARTPPYKYARPKQHSAREPSQATPPRTRHSTTLSDSQSCAFRLVGARRPRRGPWRRTRPPPTHSPYRRSLSRAFPVFPRPPRRPPPRPLQTPPPARRPRWPCPPWSCHCTEMASVAPAATPTPPQRISPRWAPYPRPLTPLRTPAAKSPPPFRRSGWTRSPPRRSIRLSCLRIP